MSISNLAEKLKDPIWRLSNLYKVKDEATGRVLPFKPRPEQLIVYEAIHRKKLRKIFIPKARRLGLSTGIDILGLDQSLWTEGFQFSLIDQTQVDASKKMHDIVYTAFDGIAEEIRDRFNVLRRNDSVFQFAIPGLNRSTFSAGMNARGGNQNGLHISEWGPIQFKDARRSEEIMTGALPSARMGFTIVETTWKGRKGGHLWTIAKNAIETPEEHRTDDDWNLIFFPWWVDPKYSTKGDISQIDSETNEYLDDIENTVGKKFLPEQRLWYYKAKQTYGLFVYSEFPSIVSECWLAPIEGAIYQKMVARAREDGRISKVPVDGSVPVNTFWDLGAPENTVVWYVQLIGRDIYIIDHDAGFDETVTERVSRMMAKGYNYGTHYVPHDGVRKNYNGWQMDQELKQAGLKNIKSVQRTIDPTIGINRVQQLFQRFVFRSPDCDEGLEALENYHWKKNESLAALRNEPEHDWSSHHADALRVLGEADMAGMLEGTSKTAVDGRRRRNKGKVLTGIRY